MHGYITNLLRFATVGRMCSQTYDHLNESYTLTMTLNCQDCTEAQKMKNYNEKERQVMLN